MMEDEDTRPQPDPDLLQQIGQDILAEACRYLGRFTVLPHTADTALVLFAAHCWAFRAWTETPRIHLTSDTYGAGKTRVMRLTALMCPRPEEIAGATGPAARRIVAERSPAPLCFDEIDVAFAGRGAKAEDLRGILNAGYEAKGKLPRIEKGEVVDDPVFCPVICAGKGKLPKSLEDRAVSICMVKRGRRQQMERFVPKMHEAMGRKIGRLLGSWVTEIAGAAGDILWMDPPEKLADRQIDILTPLYSVAQMAGGEWPGRFDEMVKVLVLGGAASDETSPAKALLSALGEVWPDGRDKLATHELAGLLAGHESGEFDWPEGQRAQELNARMRDLGIPPVPLWIGGKTMRGYQRQDVMGESLAGV